MKIQTTFQHSQFKLHYIKFGSGANYLLAFHGFGQNATRLLPLFKGLEDKYTVYCFDLFLHGKSEFPRDRSGKTPLLPEEIKKIFAAFFKTENINEFDLFGFSLGAKTVLQLLQFFPDKVNQVHLAAPDGLKLNPWYNFAARTRAGNIIFDFLLENPRVFNFLLAVIQRFNIPSKKVSKFVCQSLDSQEKRKFVRDVWFVYKALTVNIDNLAHLVLTDKSIKIHQYYGRYDTIIKPKSGKIFADRIDQPQNVHLLKTGHNLLAGNGLKLLSQKLKSRLESR